MNVTNLIHFFHIRDNFNLCDVKITLMLNHASKHLMIVFLGVFACSTAQGQKTLTLKEAERIAQNNYAAIKAKADQLNASEAYLKESKSEYLPDVTLSAQQDYGTVNSQFGPLYGLGYSVASSGPNEAKQNWNAGFGSLYLSNVNWNFFAFGRSVDKVRVQQANVSLSETDLAQERFEHQIKVAGAYLNLLAAQQLSKAQQDNLDRAADLQKVVVARVKNGLNPGVDSSQANAEVANARIALTNAQETVTEQSNLLAQYMGIAPQHFQLDSTFVTSPPANADPQASAALENHPLLRYYQNRINLSNAQAKYLSTFSYPTFSLFGVYQGRGSGFKAGYSSSLSDYSSSYGAGVSPIRFNYLIGVGLVWNITDPLRIRYQVKAQQFTSAQYQDEYNLLDQQLQDQQVLAETRIGNALKNFREVPQEVKAASDAYLQKYTLYKNGLANIVDFTQALYVLNRAETDQYIARNNVWQALLYKAATTGDFGIFINNL